MISTIESCAVCGMQCIPVLVEVDAAKGLPCFEMVGYLGSEVREARERVRIALKNIGIDIPPLRLTVNLAPAHIHKGGTSFDLPIAVGVLTALGYLTNEAVKGILMVGEIGLNGEIRPVRGVLPMVRQASMRGIRRFIVPKGNEKEGAVVEGIKVTGVEDLEQVLKYLLLPESERDRMLAPAKVDLLKLLSEESRESGLDFADVNGQEAAKRGVEVAAAGFHNVLMTGPPGAGKTMIAQRIPGILPPLDLEESLEISEIYSVAGLLNEEDVLITKRPFISPHHTISESALAGGGRIPNPGVISLAHHAVLFLDEFGEFKRNTLDILRQPMEEKKVHIARTYGKYTYPADFMLVAAMNPCPCGYFPDRHKCRCSEQQINKYLSKISGPIMDRIDICVETAPVKMKQLNSSLKAESSGEIRDRVLMARERQKERFKQTPYRFNSQMSGNDVAMFCHLGSREEALMENAFKMLSLSARGYHRVLKVARTIADLEDCDNISVNHLSEAIFYRGMDTKYDGK